MMNRRDFLGVTAAAIAATGFTGCKTLASENRMKLATFSCDVTPAIGTPIYSSFKPLATIEYPSLAKGVIIDDGVRLYVLCAMDWCELCNATYDLYRKRIAAAVGTEEKYVAIQTVHQHTAQIADAEATRMALAAHPGISLPSPESYDDPSHIIAKAAHNALNSFQFFDAVGVGAAKVEQVASNRRIPIGEGKVGFRASSCTDPKVRALPEGLIDPMLRTITFAKGDTPLVRMHYYATHPQSFYGDPRASYDFVGMARERLQEKDGAFQMYFTGCSGNIACGKYNDRSVEARQGLCDRLFAAMETSAAATKYTPMQPISWRTSLLPLRLRDDVGYGEQDAQAKLKTAKEKPLEAFGAAQALTFRQRKDKPVELTSLWIGNDIRIAHLPGEPMIEFQLYAQELAPAAFVAVAGYGDCGMGYICTESSFPEGGYEPGASHLVPAAEKDFRAAIETIVKG